MNMTTEHTASKFSDYLNDDGNTKEKDDYENKTY